MIENAAWEQILDTAGDITTVCEIYSEDQAPTADGFDPADALACFAAVNMGVTYMGVTYKRLVKKFGNISRTIKKEKNTANVEFSNLSREISQFEFSRQFEGLIMVIRVISRARSTSLALSQILFTGRCEKPTSGDKNSLSVTATWILGGREVQVPRRKFTKEDQEGRVNTDPEFEGFEFMPQTGTSSYSVRNGTKRGGIAGLFGFKKTATKTLPWSSYSDLDAKKPVPLVLGVVQVQGTHIGYADFGPAIRLRTAFADGPGFAIVNPRSLDSRLPLSPTSYDEALGGVGAANGPDDPSWVAPGLYSRTMHIRAQADNSAVDASEPVPDVVAVIYGLLMTIPDASGNWVLDDEFTDNAAAHTRMFITSPDYHNLDPNWVHDGDFTECFRFNEAFIADRSLSDFLYVPAG